MPQRTLNRPRPDDGRGAIMLQARESVFVKRLALELSMRHIVLALCGMALLAGCGERAPNPYPASAQARFEVSCPSESAVCVCTWDKITRAMTFEEYESALAQFRETGQMETRITRARTQCLERHDS